MYSRGLQYAFGITAYDGNQESIEDPTIGTMKAYYKTWGLSELAADVLFEEIPSRNCTVADFHVLGQSDPESKFFKPHDNTLGDLEFYYKKLRCLETDKIEIQGDYNSPRTRSIVFSFDKCDNNTFSGICQSDEAIN